MSLRFRISTIVAIPVLAAGALLPGSSHWSLVIPSGLGVTVMRNSHEGLTSRPVRGSRVLKVIFSFTDARSVVIDFAHAGEAGRVDRDGIGQADRVAVQVILEQGPLVRP